MAEREPKLKDLMEGLIEIEKARVKERLEPEDVDNRTKALIEKWKNCTEEK